MHIVRGESILCVLDKAESLKGEAGFLLLSVDIHYCLDIPVTPLTEQTMVLFVQFFGVFYQVSVNNRQDVQWFGISLVHMFFYH